MVTQGWGNECKQCEMRGLLLSRAGHSGIPCDAACVPNKAAHRTHQVVHEDNASEEVGPPQEHRQPPPRVVEVVPTRAQRRAVLGRAAPITTCTRAMPEAHAPHMKEGQMGPAAFAWQLQPCAQCAVAATPHQPASQANGWEPRPASALSAPSSAALQAPCQPLPTPDTPLASHAQQGA